jgi:hypothetical protein
MRWLALLMLPAFGCPAPARYAEVRPGMSCERAMRVAYRSFESLGYTVTDLIPASPERAGAITGTRQEADGRTATARVVVTCDAKGAVLQPVEESLFFSNYDFSRAFGYSFKTLAQRPDVEEPRAAVGLQVGVHALSPQEAVLDLGGVATVGGAVPVRITIRNNTDRVVSVDPARVDLAAEGGSSAAPLTGPGLEAALASGPAGDRVRGALLGSGRVAPHTSVSGYLVYPLGTYREARIAIEDLETGEVEGFVTPVE